jgi:hypothetical protein
MAVPFQEQEKKESSGLLKQISFPLSQQIKSRADGAGLEIKMGGYSIQIKYQGTNFNVRNE